MDPQSILQLNNAYPAIPPLLAGVMGNGLTSATSLNSIFDVQLSSWRGGGMKVSVRSNEKCRDCGVVFNEGNVFYCKTHDRHAQRVYLEITGLKDNPNGRAKIYSDQHGYPLHKSTCFGLKSRIIQEIGNKTFSLKRYLPRDKNKFLFKNYKIKYLEKMQWRASLDPGEDGWMSRSHLKGIKTAFNHYLHYFDEMDIQDIRTGVIQDFLDSLSISNHWKRKLMGYLGHLLRWAHEREDILTVPKIPSVKFTRKKKKGLSVDVQLGILSHVPEEHRPILEWAAETGRRINEYRAMKIRDIDFPRKVYRIGGAFDMEKYKPFPKISYHAESEYPITDRCMEILKKALKGRAYGPDDFVFIGTRGRPYSESWLREIFMEAAKKAGYTQISLNMFGRHSMGYQLREAGAGYDDIADILGNTPQIAKANYSHMEAVRRADILELRRLSCKTENVRGMSVAQNFKK